MSIGTSVNILHDEENPFSNTEESHVSSLSKDQVFICTVCKKEFPQLIHLQRHYVKHIVNKPYQCKQCDKSFFTKVNLEKHTSLHSAGKLYSCDVCNYKNLSEYQYKKHLRKHMVTNLVCNACFQGFSDAESLNKHEKSHTELQEGNFCYFCFICDSQFTNKRGLEDHMNSHEKVKPHACEVCHQEFFYSYLMDKHALAHTDKEICNLCSASFPDKPLLSDHEKKHLKIVPNAEKTLCYTCQICSSMFSQRNLLCDHYNISHEGKRPHTCKKCNKNFFFFHLLQKHKLTHKIEYPYFCDMCPRSYKFRSDLSKHYNLHLNIKQFSCPICDKKFATKGLLRQHSIVHSEQKPYSCDLCGFKFGRKDNLERHYLVHAIEKPFKCGQCGLSFVRRADCEKHCEKFTSSKHKCVVCEKSFCSQNLLLKHSRRDHPEVKGDYSCVICGKVLKHQASFTKHVKLHTGDRPFKCQFCTKTYIQKKHLVQHHSYHHSDKSLNFPYECEICGKGYLRQKRLHTHYSKHHPEIQ